MKNLIFVGGLQYSRKSTLCKDLARLGKGRYIHIDPDTNYDYVASHEDVLKRQIKRFSPMYSDEIDALSQDFTLDRMKAVAEAHGRLQDLDNVIDICATMRTADIISGIGANKSPIIESLFINRDCRSNVYNLLKEYSSGISLDDTKKLLIYFDLGLQLSLQRFIKNPTRDKSSITTRKLIIDSYNMQELPTNDEFPNLETLIISSEDNIGSARDYILREF